MVCCCELTLKIFGVLALVKVGWLIVKGLCSIFSALFGAGPSPKKFGEWAVVTGVTSGIGEAYAHEFARRKFNIVLVGRTKSALDRVATEIQDKYKVKTTIVQLDLSKATSDDFTRCGKEILAAGDIGILVNNAGVSYDIPDFFAEVPIEVHRDNIQVNNRAMVELTYAVLGYMVSKKRGAIVNVSSVLGSIPASLLATYGASKAFVDSFSQSLSTEYKSKGIVVQACTPAFVVSKMSKVRKASLFTPSATTFARAAVKAIGGCEVQSVPYIPHKFQAWAFWAIPTELFTGIVHKQHLDIKRRALAKKAREAKAQ